MTVFAERLLQLKKESGKNFHELERDGIGISKSMLAYWCRTDVLPNSKSIIQLCRYFDVSADWLLGISNFRKIKR